MKQALIQHVAEASRGSMLAREFPRASVGSRACAATKKFVGTRFGTALIVVAAVATMVFGQANQRAKVDQTVGKQGNVLYIPVEK